jgi:hypothetical protein
VWPSLADFREDVGVEQPGGHRATSRTRIRDRGGSMLLDRCGDVCSASTRTFPLRSPARRRKSSAPMITTSSRPWTVTCCGPSSFARRTTSLNLALASCSCHCAGRPRRGLRFRPAADEVFARLVMLTRLPHAVRSTEYVTPTANSGPTGLSFDDEGHLWFTEQVRSHWRSLVYGGRRERHRTHDPGGRVHGVPASDCEQQPARNNCGHLRQSHVVHRGEHESRWPN